MMLPGKIKTYMAEPIIRLIIYHVLFILLVVGVVFYTKYHADHYYEKPARENIANQNNKEKLAHIIKRELLQIDAQYRAMLLSRNTKQIRNLSKKSVKSINHVQKVLPVLQNGGTVTDVVLVNFYDKDEIKEEIAYFKHSKEEISVDVINLSPKLAELNEFLNKSSRLLIEEISKENAGFISGNFELAMLIKQTEALLLRLWESANKISYDIKQANLASEKRIIKTRDAVKKIVLIVNIAGISLVILFAILIALRILKILITKKEADAKIKQANLAMNIIIDNIPVGVVLVNSKKKIIQVNESASKTLKYESHNHANQKLVGYRCDQGFCITDGDQCPILDSGESKILFTEKKVIPGDGSNKEITILKSVIPITLDDQYVLMEVFVDISERKKHEQELDKYRQHLEILVKKRTKELEQAQKELISKAVEAGRVQLSAMVLHNIGNAITPVVINLDTLKRVN